MPKELEPGKLYFSEEFGVSGHLCACGCGNKIILPIGPVEWSITAEGDKPTLHPSVGNWELPCKSHYWIENGVVEWSTEWSEEQVIAGRVAEERRRKLYFDNLSQKRRKPTMFSRLIEWLFG
jgi:hypothetical protein